MYFSSARAHELGCAAVIAAFGALPVISVAQTETPQEIIVTGSRIARPNLTQPTPVTTVASEDLRVSGTPDLGKVLSELPALGSLGTETDEAIYDPLGRNYFVGVRSSF